MGFILPSLLYDLHSDQNPTLLKAKNFPDIWLMEKIKSLATNFINLKQLWALYPVFLETNKTIVHNESLH